MRIALVIFRAEPSRGGAERYAMDLGLQLQLRGHEVSVLSSTFGDIGTLKRVATTCPGVTRTARYRRFVDRVESVVQAEQFDVVHAFLPVRSCHVYHAQAGLETLSLKQHRLLKHSLIGQAIAQVDALTNRKRKAFAEVERALIEGPRSPITICLSKRERDDAVKTFPIAQADRFVAMYNGIDTSRFEPTNLQERRESRRKKLGIASDSPVLLFVGNDFARKGLDTAIRALGALRDVKPVLIVVGSDEIGPFSELAAKVGTIGRVLFVGRSDRVADFMAASDVLVLPSRFEPFGMVVIESMLMGVPPIVSRACGASEVIRHDVDGLVIDSANDVPSWSAAITRAIDPQVHESMHQACLARRVEFDYARHVDDVLALYMRARSR
jgi:UDP-glucose:(heptosyl)LPS alpha-1,3-glucosyltransferase